jgi:methyltransferase family protein
MRNCCAAVVPVNAARSFTHPAPILGKTRVRDLLASCRGGRGVEIGSGCLRNSIHLLKTGFHMTAVDLPGIEERFPNQYSEFRRRGGRVILASLQDRKLYDFAVCTFVIETICRPGVRLDLLVRTRKALRESGFLIISVRGRADVVTASNSGLRCSDGFFTPNKTFARAFDRNELRRVLASAGFGEIEFLHKLESKTPELLHAIAHRRAK